MSNFKAVAVHIVETIAASIENEGQALELLASRIDVVLWCDDEAQGLEGLEDCYPDFSPEDLQEFDPRTCRACALALAKAIESYGFELSSLAHLVAENHKAHAFRLDPDRSRNIWGQ